MPHMKINIKKNICPVKELPEGYTTTLIDVSDLTQLDKKNWYKIQHQRENVKNHDNIILPERGIATFVKYNGDVIACCCLKHISDDIIEHRHAMTIPCHRRKGVFKALVGVAWRYSYLKGYSWINLSPSVQVNFWKKIGAEMNWET
jgi:hypothetical protein